MTAPRRPPGWTPEAERLVRQDWLACRDGEGGIIPIAPETPYRIAERFAEKIPESQSELSEAQVETALICLGEAGLVEFSGYHGWLLSPEARLRAWAAVGAPVLAPAEDGRPSLAEWVAAAEGSALGRPVWEFAEVYVSLVARWGEVGASTALDWAGGPTLAWINCVGAGQTIASSPAALRAALDKLAVKP